MKATSYNENPEYEKEKRIMELYKKMVDGELTEDEFKAESASLTRALEAKQKKIRQEDMEDYVEEKKEKESYGEYFHKNKSEFKNILGI